MIPADTPQTLFTFSTRAVAALEIVACFRGDTPQREDVHVRFRFGDVVDVLTIR